MKNLHDNSFFSDPINPQQEAREIAADAMGLLAIWMADAPSLEAAIALEDRQQAIAASSRDFQEGVRAFVERRPPVFEGR